MGELMGLMECTEKDLSFPLDCILDLLKSIR